MFLVNRNQLLMLYREIIAFYSEINTKNIHTLRGQNVEFVNVKYDSTLTNGLLKG